MRTRIIFSCRIVSLLSMIVLIGIVSPVLGETLAQIDPADFGVITTEKSDQIVQVDRWGRGWISDVAWAPDGKTLAVGSSLGIWLYAADDMEAEPRLIEGHTRPVRSVAFSPDGTLLASGSWDGTVRLWGVPRQE